VLKFAGVRARAKSWCRAENIGVLVHALNFGTTRRNVGVLVCALNFGIAW
jgi:hypothetical protein